MRPRLEMVGVIFMPKKKTQEQFIEEANRVHSGKYDYSLTDYVNSSKKVKIICKIHGEFLQKAGDHLKGSGCRKCAIEHNKRLVTDSKEDFVKKAVEVHGNRYDYSLSEYKLSSKPVNILCRVHGEFLQKAGAHLMGSGCKKCGIISRSKLRSFNTELFIEKARAIHKDTYDYSLVEYTLHKNCVKIICSIHGVFSQQAAHHLSGSGCLECGKRLGGYNRTKFKDAVKRKGVGYLYIVKLSNSSESFMKIGITSRSFRERFAKFPYTCTVLHIEEFTDGALMFNSENYLLHKFKNKQYIPSTVFHGSTECLFISTFEDVLNSLHEYILLNKEAYEESSTD